MKLGPFGLAVLTVACAGAQATQWEASRTRGTFSHSGILPAGTRIDFDIHALPKNHSFFANKCGPGCNTAKLVMRVEGRGLDHQTASLTIKEDGRYYFWIQQRTETGETGAIFVSDVKTMSRGFSVSFRDGTTVTGAVQSHD